MKKIDTEILIIGGGATGAGVARDAAMRGFKTVLVEKNDLSQGTTGRYHGLLHSGGRYVVKDPQAAVECIDENRILRRIMPFCIEDTGGFFVSTPWDDPDFASLFLAGCQSAGIPVEEISISQMLREEPRLNPQIRRCFRVPDASADSFIATDANAESARQYGAQILPYHPVTGLLREGDRVTGARCQDRVNQEEVVINADLVINASGAWSGQLAGMVGVLVDVVPGKGTMVAVNHRILNTVVNRCKRPSDADIIVPAHTVAVIGTTDVAVEDPDHYSVEPWEVQLMIDEGEKLVPGLKDIRILRAWAGVRPLYRGASDPGQAGSDREISRSYVLLDHEARDGLSGFITITGGKWTTYRQMAEVTVDLACAKLGTQRECRTAQELLPEPSYMRHTSAAQYAGYQTGSGDGENQRSRIQNTAENTTVGGAWYRLVVDSDVERKAGYLGPSTLGLTATEHHTLGARLAAVEADAAYGDLICECELATYQDVSRSIVEGNARTFDDVRRDVRLGMGPCQGGFCTVRAAGMLHALTNSPVHATNAALRDYLQERWKGLVPVLWGQQLRQERLDELIYLSVLNADHLPGPEHTDFAPVPYSAPDPASWEKIGLSSIQVETPVLPGEAPGDGRPAAIPGSSAQPSAPLDRPAYYDTLVLGAGLAGLTAAWQLSRSGQRVHLVTKGWGSNYWHAGCVDVLGYYPIDSDSPVESPEQALRDLIAAEPNHPYAKVGVDGIAGALAAFQELCAQSGYPMHGSLDRNHLLPSSTGAFRPTCLAPETMIAGDLRNPDPMLLVGFKKFRDFYPELAAANLTAQGITATGVTLDLPFMDERTFLYSRSLSVMFDIPDYRREFAAAIRPYLSGIRRVGFPAVLGIDDPLEVIRDLQELLGIPVFEIPVLPASIPGVRLTNLFVSAIRSAGSRVHDGMLAVGSHSENGRVAKIFTESASRAKPHAAGNFLLATGGILGGGIVTSMDGRVREVVCEAPVSAPAGRAGWLEDTFLSTQGHPIYRAGLMVDSSFRMVDGRGQPLYSNLYAAGTGLEGGEYIRERSYDGVAIATGYVAARQITGNLTTAQRSER